MKLTNASTGEYVSFVPDFGATINDVVLAKGARRYKLTDSSDTYESLISEGRDQYKGSKLSPFPNRVRDGKYQFGGQNYQLPINFPYQKHAIHGLVYERRFEVVGKKVSDQGASMELVYHYPGDVSGYPFPYRLGIVYSLSSKGGVKCQTTVENTGEVAIPMADGWHPYFRTGTKVDDLFLTLPAQKVLEVDKRLIPTGGILYDRRFSKPHKIGTHTFDTCYQITSPKKYVQTVVTDPIQGISLVVWQESGKYQYRYLQVYTPASRDSIAIEPMTGAPDAFNNKMGLMVLKPTQKRSSSWGVYLS